MANTSLHTQYPHGHDYLSTAHYAVTTEVKMEPMTDDTNSAGEAQAMETEPTGPTKKSVCLNCGEGFKKLAKGLNRSRPSRVCNVSIFNAVFEKAIPKEEYQKAFACNPCLHLLVTKTVKVKKSSIKRTLPKKRPENRGKNRDRRSAFITTAQRLLKDYNFRQLFRYLLRNSNTARSAFQQIFLDLVYGESRVMMRQGKYEGAFGGPLSFPRLKNFSWTKAIREADDKTPLLTSVLRSSIQTKEIQRSSYPQVRAGPMNACTERRLGMILALVYHARSSRVCNFVQAVMDVELWKRGSTLQELTTLSRFGICRTVTTAMHGVDRLVKDHDVPVCEWKAKLESLGKNTPGEKVKEFTYPYSICMDSVRSDPHGRIQQLVHKPDPLPWTLPFAYSSRVPCKYLKNRCTVSAYQLVPHILPDTSKRGDLVNLKDLMVNLVMRMLTKNLPFLEGLKEYIPSVQHKFSREMCNRTQVVNLGVLQVDPTSTEGVAAIMDHLHTYVPHAHKGGLIPILCGGDGQVLEKMADAKRARAGGETQTAKLQGLVECPQEHHKEKILLQDTLNMLYSDSSSAARGTLSHLKLFYKANRQKMKPDVKTHFKHAWDLMEFSTESYVTLFAMTATDMQSVSDVPIVFPRYGTRSRRLEWLRIMAEHAVEFCWMGPPPGDIQRVISAAMSDGLEGPRQGRVCTCAEDTDGALVQCCSQRCLTSWFHLRCVNLQEPPDGNWFCSQRCSADGTYIYCTCRRRKDGQMVQCALGESCRRRHWYHAACLQQQTFPEVWYCSEECTPVTPDDDYVQNYTKALMWRGLNHLARRFAVSQGDGERMKSHWKLDLLDFWNYGHRLDLQIAQHFLTGASGFFRKRLVEDIVWNRVANLSGTEGGNVGLDLVNQYLNEEFKEMLLLSRGRYSVQQHVERAAKMTGAFGREVSRLVSDGGLEDFMRPKSKSKTGAGLHKKYILEFLAEYRNDGLFDYLPGRQHAGFERYKYSAHLRYPVLLGRKLRKYAKEMDAWKESTA